RAPPHPDAGPPLPPLPPHRSRPGPPRRARHRRLLPVVGPPPAGHRSRRLARPLARVVYAARVRSLPPRLGQGGLLRPARRRAPPPAPRRLRRGCRAPLLVVRRDRGAATRLEARPSNSYSVAACQGGHR